MNFYKTFSHYMYNYLKLCNHFQNDSMSNGNRTEWSPIWAVIIRVITKLDNHPAGVRFVYHAQNMFILPPPPPTEGIGVSWGLGDSVGPKNVKKSMKLQWGGGGGLRKNPFRGGGMDIFWNYTISEKRRTDKLLKKEQICIKIPTKDM